MDLEDFPFDADTYHGAVDEDTRIAMRLAVAVIRRAFQDLTIDAYKNKVYCQALRQDAYEFLTVRFWESGCHWHDILGDILPKHAVLRAVKRVCYLKEGKVTKL